MRFKDAGYYSGSTATEKIERGNEQAQKGVR
jgi:hypothetical protein